MMAQYAYTYHTTASTSTSHQGTVIITLSLTNLINVAAARHAKFDAFIRAEEARLIHSFTDGDVKT